MPILATSLWGVVVVVWLYRGYVLIKQGIIPSPWFMVFVLVAIIGALAAFARIIFEPADAFGIGMYLNVALALFMLIIALFAHKL